MRFIIICTHILSILTLAYLSTALTIQFLAPGDNLFDPKLEDVTYLRFLLSLALSTAALGSFVAIRMGYLKYQPFTQEKRQLLFGYTVAGFFLANFYASFIGPSLIRWIIILVGTFAGLLCLPTLISFFGTLRPRAIVEDMLYPKAHLTPTSGKAAMVHTLTVYGVSLCIIVLASLSILHIVRIYTSGKVAAENQLRDTLHIRSLSPAKTTHAEFVTIYGYNFGWRADDRSRVMSSDGEIPAGDWTNTRIYVEIPLHIKEGVREIWIERPKDDHNERSKIISSNKVKLAVESRFVYFPDYNDSLYTKLMKKAKLLTHRHFEFIAQFLL